MNKRKIRSVFSVIYNIIGVLGTIAMFVFLPLNVAICFSGFLDCPLIILDVISYQNYVQRYPLNNLNEYKINLTKDNFTKYDELRDIYYIVLENDKGFYKTIDCEKKLIFDMTRFFMPKTYLRSYFIRNIHFKIINKDHLPLSYLSKSQRVSLKFKYQNLKIAFLTRKKRKEYWIVKKGKIIINPLIADMIGLPFSNRVTMSKYNNSYFTKYEKVYEEDYAFFKRCCK